MKLETPIVEIVKCPDGIFNYLIEYASSLNWNNVDLLTKEEAFFDQSYRYEAVTDYFTEQSLYFSKLPPSRDITDKLKPYTDFLLSTVFPDYKLFRCQLVTLNPGQTVYPHIDPRYYHKYGKRIHLPLVVNKRSYHVHFRPDNNYDMSFSKFTLQMITDFDNITPHSAFNFGDSPRLHIICDVVKNSVVTRIEEALHGNPNATNPETVKEYYFHVKNIETRYNCKYQDLSPHYLEKMKEYE